jgi:hypothetical protein
MRRLGSPAKSQANLPRRLHLPLFQSQYLAKHIAGVIGGIECRDHLLDRLRDRLKPYRSRLPCPMRGEPKRHNRHVDNVGCGQKPAWSFPDLFWKHARLQQLIHFGVESHHLRGVARQRRRAARSSRSLLPSGQDCQLDEDMADFSER